MYDGGEAERLSGPGPDVSVVVPLYNERESLAELVAELTAVLDAHDLDFEIWLIDDGSDDGSWEEVERLSQAEGRIRGLRFLRNYGKSAALAVGFERTTGRYVVTIDADLQDDPAEIPAMIAKLEEGFDLVSGWKRERRDPLRKKVPSRFFNLVTRKMSGIPLHDFNCGLKAYRAEVVKSVRVYGELHRYIPLLASWNGYDCIAEQSVEHRPRRYGTTKFGLERFIRGFLDLVTVLFITRFARRPMHFFGTLGTAAFLGGFVISFYLSFQKLVMGQSLSDRPLLLLGALLLLLGAQMFLTGLLGEMIIKPRMETTATYQIRDTVGKVEIHPST